MNKLNLTRDSLTFYTELIFVDKRSKYVTLTNYYYWGDKIWTFIYEAAYNMKKLTLILLTKLFGI